jgi:tight adherence protein B
MDQNTLLLLYGLIFMGVLLAIDGISQLAAGHRRGPGAINRRLRLLAANTDPEQVLQQLRRKAETKGLARLAPFSALAKLAVQAGLRLPLGGLLLIMIGIAAVIGVLAAPALGLPVAAAAGLAGGVALPLFWLRLRRGRRLKAVAARLPDAIDLAVRSLRAGQPLSAALRIVARETSDPLGSEIGLLVDEVTYGKTLPDAATDMAERIGLEDVQYLVVAIKIQHGTGGNLAEILTALSRVVRERAAMVQKIQAVSAEGRLSANVLSAFPAVLATVIQLVSPTYFGDVADDPLFMPLMMFVGVMMVLNFVVTRRLVNFDF